jgi:hypothetical protein
LPAAVTNDVGAASPSTGILAVTSLNSGGFAWWLLTQNLSSLPWGGITYYFQAAELAAPTPGGFYFSNAVQITP